MIYIMVTSWANHWDNLSNSSTHYTAGMLKNEELKKEHINNTKTIFIKRNKETSAVG